MADRTHFYNDLLPIGLCNKGCQIYDSERDELNYCKLFNAEIPEWYIGDQNPLTHIEGKCSLKEREENYYAET